MSPRPKELRRIPFRLKAKQDYSLVMKDGIGFQKSIKSYGPVDTSVCEMIHEQDLYDMTQ